MRIEIKTLRRTAPKDKEIRALYIIQHGLDICSERMRVAMLHYFADKLGFKLVLKEDTTQ